MRWLLHSAKSSTAKSTAQARRNRGRPVCKAIAAKDVTPRTSAILRLTRRLGTDHAFTVAAVGVQRQHRRRRRPSHHQLRRLLQPLRHGHLRLQLRQRLRQPRHSHLLRRQRLRQPQRRQRPPLRQQLQRPVLHLLQRRRLLRDRLRQQGLAPSRMFDLLRHRGLCKRLAMSNEGRLMKAAQPLKSYSALLIAHALACTGPGLAGAAMISINPSKDNTLYEYVPADGDRSNGAGFHFFTGTTATDLIRRGVIAFDIAGSIPAGSTIIAVSLSMNMSMTPAGAITV